MLDTTPLQHHLHYDAQEARHSAHSAMKMMQAQLLVLLRWQLLLVAVHC